MIKVYTPTSTRPIEHSEGGSFDVGQGGHLFLYEGQHVRIVAAYAPGMWVSVRLETATR